MINPYLLDEEDLLTQFQALIWSQAPDLIRSLVYNGTISVYSALLEPIREQVGPVAFRVRHMELEK